MATPVLSMKQRPATVAFYLPQFYPIPENDGWYGEGFTEWRNVVTARPLFEGHYQPRIPKDFGFYDLRVAEVREAQARAARDHGIDAFCYYHYWFEGHRPLRRVIDDVLDHGCPRIPFCLAWANENWSRHWDASEHEVLLKQTYSDEDDEAHGRFLLRAMTNPLYLRIEGRPVLFIYRIQALPDAARTLARWRALWRAEGLPDVTVIKFDTHGDASDPSRFGADVSAQFLPHGLSNLVPGIAVPDARPGNVVWRYADIVRAHLSLTAPAWTRYECVFPSWDNTPRRGDGRSTIVHDSSPERYEGWLSAVRSRTPANGLVLINAWNEWAEGAYLEPDLRFGRSYLEATARAVGHTPAPGLPESATPGEPLAPTGEMFATLYLDALESETHVRRRLSRLEATFQRQLDEATNEARAEADEMRGHAVRFAQEIDRLHAELSGPTDGVPAADTGSSGPTVVCVLGMHRSGTSFITRALSHLGVYLGPEDHAVGVREDNPLGFSEHNDITHLNDEMLTTLGGSWHTPPLLPPGWEDDQRLDGFDARARKILREDFGSSLLWGFKDPRTCLTLPFWQRFVPSMRYVICVRSPLDVALSLHARDGFSIEKGASLWIDHVRAALMHSAGKPRLLVSYDDLIERQEIEVARLAAFIGRPAPAESRLAVRSLTDTNLRHHRTPMVAVINDPRLPFPAKALYLSLRLLLEAQRRRPASQLDASSIYEAAVERLSEEAYALKSAGDDGGS